jgi:hypothetical protein
LKARSPRASSMPVWVPWLGLAGLALIAFVAAVSVGRWLYPLGSVNHDEPMYTFEARLLLHGHLTWPASYAPFRPWASGVRHGRLVLKYTPVWPAVLAIGDRLGSTRIGPAAGAAGAVVLTGLLGRELFGRWAVGLLAAAVLVLSPLFVLQAATYLPYLFQLVLDLAVALLVLGALRRWPVQGKAPTRVVVRLCAGGAVWGIALFARPYDAVLLAVPIACAAVASAWRYPRRLLTWGACSALGAAIPVAALLAYNGVLMGSPLRSTFSITSANDTLGFGTRGVFRTSAFGYTPANARFSVEQSLSQLPGWTFGGVLLVVVALYGLWHHRRRGFDVWAIAGLAASFTLGYALFWSPYSIVKLWPGARTMGPFYHLPLLIPLVVFAAAGLVTIFDRNRVIGGVTVGALVVVTVIAAGPRLDRNRNVTRQYQAVERLVGDARLGRAVLFTDDRGTLGFESAAPFLENDATLRQPVVYALDAGPADFAVLAAFPDRTAARMRAELRPGDSLLDPTRFVERLHVESGAEVTLHFRVVNTVGAPTVVTTLRIGTANRAVVLDRSSTRGATYNVTWTIVAGPHVAHAAPTVVSVPNASGEVAIEADFDARGHAPQRYELQYPYIADVVRLSLLTPGWGRYLFQYRAPTWLNQDVSPTLAEVP